MNYTLLKELIDMCEQFESASQNNKYPNDIHGFRQWVCGKSGAEEPRPEPGWDGKEKGRTPESVISTMIVHMNRYAKTYSKSAIHGTDFSTQEEFIYLITLTAYGEMTKTELIRRNIQDKPSGMLIINRLLQQGWVVQVDSAVDKRSKVLRLTAKGKAALGQIKKRIDTATQLVAGDLTRPEKLELIRLLQKLEQFHEPIFLKNIDRAELLDTVRTAIPSKTI
ncbi:MAG TPA: MarR family winged helix-turn-helix transcriptional regulator [Puia sp.]|uniref:MarR family winged helix-turn-helix transcriptional regulator n=1 Tax=Puia sp. TaxID=2045100 RepID=UPI002BC80404|nr:MarR family winged helix-turn-helix transcriptional regulator [Puia sp.]HVU98699.1 MarR family winged helix-turn-helix transcriptional regulator [Puia sp.]